MKRRYIALWLVLGSVAVWAAIDSLDRRSSVVNVGTNYVDLLPSADGTIDAEDRQHLAGEYSGLTADEPPPVVFVLTGLPIGWEPWYDVQNEAEFVYNKILECDTDGTWASWLSGTNPTPRGSDNCRVNELLIRQEASGSAQWARWAPGTVSRNSANLQIDVRAALTADFVPN